MTYRRDRRLTSLLGIGCAIGALALSGPVAVAAASPPQVTLLPVEGVTATGADLRGSVDPEGRATTYRFEYIAASAYEANLAAGHEPFAGSAFAPVSGRGAIGAGSSPIPVAQQLSSLTPATPYRYRLRAVNTAEEVALSVTRPFATESPTNVFELLDHRGWEMVSPVQKNGGAIQAPGSIFGGGVFQAAAGGGAMTYSSSDSFGASAAGAPPGSQYLAARAEAGWTTSDLTTPLLSGSYGDNPVGVPYQVFSSNLSSGLLSNGERCRGNAGGECPVANPPLPGSGAPAGYRDYYRRTSAGSFESILTQGDLSHTALGPERFEMRLVAATPDLEHVVVSSCAALAPGAIEVAAPGGCDPEDQNLYEWAGGELSTVNFLPGQVTSSPGAGIGASSGAVSAGGSRVYFRVGDDLYLREGNATKLVDESSAGAEFEVASSDGTVAYVLDAGNLYRYLAADGSLTALTVSGEVEGVLGTSPDGSRVFYAEPSGVFSREGSTTKQVAAGGSSSDWPPATGTARVSSDGRYLLFLSNLELTGYPSEGTTEAYLYGPAGTSSATLACVSCNPNGERPEGAASIPGAVANGSGAGAFDAYKPRVLSTGGSRVFFDSEDRLVPQDSDSRPDVYEWEDAGVGTCADAGGCIQLISSGRSSEASTFLDASADGSDVFFLTSESIYPLDPGSSDVYDARVGGGLAVPTGPTPCVADACQILPEAPEDPTPGTLFPSAGNPPLHAAGEKSKKKTKTKKRKHAAKKKHRGAGR